jgi:hypothetical protein
VSYNQPKFSPNAAWNLYGITFANIAYVGSSPSGMFINKNNTIYVVNRASSRLVIWSEGTPMPTRNLTGNLSFPSSVFVRLNGDVYIDNGNLSARVNKWAWNSSNLTIAMIVKQTCYSIFVDINDNLYCSMTNLHYVATRSWNTNSNMWSIAAGTECVGNTSSQLMNPRGIFVDTNLDLYVADCGNDRVQLFSPNQSSAMTVAGRQAPDTITLFCPSAIVLDADGYLFIADSSNHRIVADSPFGFRCLVGCYDGSGSAGNQLYNPTGLSFDSYGNLFVLDQTNARIQKFMLISNTSPAIGKYIVMIHRSIGERRSHFYCCQGLSSQCVPLDFASKNSDESDAIILIKNEPLHLSRLYLSVMYQ